MAVGHEQLGDATQMAQPQKQISTQQEWLRPLAGLRASANIGIMVLHLLWLRHHLPGGAESLHASMRLWPVRAMFAGLTGMDVLFLLCGFHAALTLVPALSIPGASPRQVVLQYWWRRIVRIVPAYYAALAASWFLLMHPAVRPDPEPVVEAATASLVFNPAACPGGLWRAAAFVSNWDMSLACGAQFWSMSVMGQFWMAAPLALAALRPQQPGFRRRVALGAGIMVALSTAVRVTLIVWLKMQLPLAIFMSEDPMEAANLGVHMALHVSLLGRLAGLSIGVLLALLFMAQQGEPRAPTQLSVASPPSLVRGRRTAVAAAGVAAAAVLLGFVHTRWTGSKSEPRWPTSVALPFTALMQGGAGVSAALAAFTYACMTQAGPLGRVGHWMLSGGLWPLLADLSYSAYLYHMQVRIWVWRYGLLPTGLAKNAEDMQGLAIEMAVLLPATYAVAWLSLRLIERPAAQLLRKLAAACLPLNGGNAAFSGKTDESMQARSVLKAD